MLEERIVNRSAWMLLHISSNPLKTSNDNNNPDKAIVMQKGGCSGSVRHVMDVVSIFLLV